MPVSLVTRSFALAAPYAWFDWATRFKDRDGYVGPRYFADFASDTAGRLKVAGPCGGLIPTYDELRCDDFDPMAVDPLIREFYRHSATFGLRIVENRWNPWLGGVPQLWRAVAAWLGQFTFPVNEIGNVESQYEYLDIDGDGADDFVCWIRHVVRDGTKDGELFYAGAFRPFLSVVDGRLSAFLACAFPLPGCNLAAVLKFHNEPDGGFRASSLPDSAAPTPPSKHAESGSYIGSREAGTYIVVPGARTLSLFPALGLHEDLQFRVENDHRGVPYIYGEHRCYWLGLRAFTLVYEIRP